MKKSIFSTLFSLLLLSLVVQSGAGPVSSAKISEPQVGITTAMSSVTPPASTLEWPLQPFFASTSFGVLICHVPCTSHSQCRTYCEGLGQIVGTCVYDLGLQCLNSREDRYCSCN